MMSTLLNPNKIYTTLALKMRQSKKLERMHSEEAKEIEEPDGNVEDTTNDAIAPFHRNPFISSNIPQFLPNNDEVNNIPPSPPPIEDQPIFAVSENANDLQHEEKKIETDVPVTGIATLVNKDQNFGSSFGPKETVGIEESEENQPCNLVLFNNFCSRFYCPY